MLPQAIWTVPALKRPFGREPRNSCQWHAFRGRFQTRRLPGPMARLACGSMV